MDLPMHLYNFFCVANQWYPGHGSFRPLDILVMGTASLLCFFLLAMNVLIGILCLNSKDGLISSFCMGLTYLIVISISYILFADDSIMIDDLGCEQMVHLRCAVTWF